MTPISPQNYKAAQRSIANIRPALAAIDKVDAETLKGDIRAISILQSFRRALSKINDEHQQTIDKGEAQYESRPQALINLAAARLCEVPRLIAKEEAIFKGLLKTRELKAAELLKRFSPEEVDRIVPPIGSDEAAMLHARVRDLKAEAAALEAFLADAPRYDIGLLKNTNVQASVEV